MSNFTKALKSGFENLEAELLKDDTPDTGLDAAIPDDDTSKITTDAKLSNVDEDDLFDMGYNENEADKSDKSDNSNVANEDNNEYPTDMELKDDKDSKEIKAIKEIKADKDLLDDKEILADKEINDKEPLEQDINAAYDRIWGFFKEWTALTKEEKKEITKGKDILSFTPVKAMDMLEDWKESKRIHIGDIISNGGVTGICIGINDKDDDNRYLVSTGDKKPLCFNADDTIKTEKHIDIKGLL